MATPKIVLYTNHRCPWAHRAHIALAELGLPFTEEIIDLDTPRTPEYLAINPRGLVPTINYDGEIIPESGIVAQFLADAHPSHLVPPSSAPEGALRRARIAFFVDAFFSKFHSHLFKLYGAKTDEDGLAVVDAAVQGALKEVEPLLKDAKPYFGGSDKLTLAEVLTASFAIRLHSIAKADLYPATTALGTALREKAPHTWKWIKAVSAHPSVTNIYDEAKILEGTKKRIEKARATA